MADNNNESEGLFSLRNLLFLLLSAILSGLMVFQSNWEPKRPAPEKDPRREEGIQLDARLWMDPLELPRRDLVGGASHATGEADFGGQIIRHLTDPTNTENKIRILAVLLDGDPYAESTERRRRTRYAVLSGLMASKFGYQPEDRNHIRYLRLERPFDYYDPHHEPRVLSHVERLMPEVIPYEWFSAEDRRKQGAPVLVLWLDEGQISERPLQKLLVLKNLLRLFPLAALYDKQDTGAVFYRETLLQKKLQEVLAKDSPPRVVREAQVWIDHLLGKLHSKQDRKILVEWLEPLETLWKCGHSKNVPTAEEKQCEEAYRFINPKKRQARKGKPRSNPDKIALDLPPHSYLFQILGASASAEVITELGDWLKNYANGREVVFRPEAYDFRVIGPGSSDTLKAMVQDIQSDQFPEEYFWIDPFLPVKDPVFTMYSPSASATELQLLGGNLNEDGCLESSMWCCLPAEDSGTSADQCRVQDHSVEPLQVIETSPNHQSCKLSCLKSLFHRRGIDLRRMIETDEELADALVEEMGKRGIETKAEKRSELLGSDTGTKADTGSGCNDEAGLNQPSGQQDPDCRVDVSIRDHVALVFESDTTYARGLKNSFVQSLCREDAVGAPLGDQIDQLIEACRRRRESLSFSYFQGLDGEGGAKPKFDNARAGKQGSVGNAPTSLEDLIRLTRPEPTKASFADDQTDYLERIAAEMQHRDQNLRRHQQSIRAIGLLGGDVFDKIMLLTALRPRFPDAVFFTTELDNRYVDGTADPLIARNLLIASNFDLKREPGVQRFIPPFRSSDQTAYFSATLAALEPEEPNSPVSYQHYGRPRLFEVGRTRMVPLYRSNNEPEANGCPPDNDDSKSELCGASSSWSLPPCHRLIPWLLLWCIVGFSVIALAPTESRGLLVLLMIVAFLGFLLIWCGGYHSTEPFSWTEGVSIWPTEFIRLIAIVVGLYGCRN